MKSSSRGKSSSLPGSPGSGHQCGSGSDSGLQRLCLSWCQGCSELALHPWDVALHLHRVLEDTALDIFHLKEGCCGLDILSQQWVARNVQTKSCRLFGCGLAYCRTQWNRNWYQLGQWSQEYPRGYVSHIHEVKGVPSLHVSPQPVCDSFQALLSSSLKTRYTSPKSPNSSFSFLSIPKKVSTCTASFLHIGTVLYVSRRLALWKAFNWWHRFLTLCSNLFLEKGGHRKQTWQPRRGLALRSQGPTEYPHTGNWHLVQ